MDLPVQLLESLKGQEGFDENSFIKAHSQPAGVSIRINPAKNYVPSFEGINLSPVPWSTHGYYLDARPSFTFDPLFHAGTYYVQEASSMFLEQAFVQFADLSGPLKVLDLSAAPGGKSTHIQSLLPLGSLLVSNDVIRSRASILKQNIIKWGSDNVIVTSNDPQHFQRLESFFDVIVVDAPCSGSGLFRKDQEAIHEWSVDNVALCCGRQRRILADVMPALKPGGLLIYSTCSYSKEENEDIADWLITDLQMDPQSMRVQPEWGIVATTSKEGGYGYRFYPGKAKGEGFFMTCFRLGGTPASKKLKLQSLEKLNQKEIAVVSKWMDSKEHSFIRHGNSVIAFPSTLTDAFSQLQSHLFLQYAGVLVGELIRDKLVPDHALALSTFVSGHIARVELSLDDAIRYLQRADISVSPAEKGWQLACYKGNPLGWINVLSGRINNYYPKEMRILTQRKDDD